MFDRKRPFYVTEPRLGYAVTLATNMLEAANAAYQNTPDREEKAYWSGYWGAWSHVIKMLEGQAAPSANIAMTEGFEQYTTWLKSRGDI